MKRINVLLSLFLCNLLPIISCYEIAQVNMFGKLVTTVTLTKLPYRNESASGEIAYSSSIVYNLEKFVYEPLEKAGTDIEGAGFNFYFVNIAPKGSQPNISSIPAENRFIKLEIFVQRTDFPASNDFELYYSTWNEGGGEAYISIEDFWNGDFDVHVESAGVDIIENALENKEKELFFLFKMTFEGVFDETNLSSFGNYFDVNITFNCLTNFIAEMP